MMDRPKDAGGATAFVRRYLDLMERRALDEAQGLLAPGAILTFPGGRKPSSTAAIAGGSASKYRRVAKKFDGWDVCPREPEGWIVFAHGTLFGEWIDGTPFENVRFIDRFEVAAEGIVRQDVWNDTALAQPAMGVPAPAQGGFGDDRLDRIFGVVWSLAGEAWRLEDRLDRFEALLADQGTVTRRALAEATLSAEAKSGQANRRRDYVERLLASFTKP
jgi:hypothetical protein